MTRILTDSMIYPGHELCGGQQKPTSRHCKSSLSRTVELLQEKMAAHQWIEPLVEYIEFKYMGGASYTTLLTKSVICINTVYSKSDIKKEVKINFDLSKLVDGTGPKSISDQMFAAITASLWQIKSEADEVSRRIKMVDAGTEIRVLESLA